MNTKQPEQQQKPLAGKVAVVTGASRGGGRGIAVELGAAGATVYVTGRSTREAPATSYAGLLKQAGAEPRCPAASTTRPRRSPGPVGAASRSAATTPTRHRSAS